MNDEPIDEGIISQGKFVGSGNISFRTSSRSGASGKHEHGLDIGAKRNFSHEKASADRSSGNAEKREKEIEKRNKDAEQRRKETLKMAKEELEEGKKSGKKPGGSLLGDPRVQKALMVQRVLSGKSATKSNDSKKNVSENNDGTEARTKIKNVARPGDVEPTSEKSTLNKTTQIKTKIIDEGKPFMSDRNFGLPVSVINAVRQIVEKKSDEDSGDPKKMSGGKTQVDLEPTTNDKIDESEPKKNHTTPKTPKEKKLAALASPKDKITHKDVLVGRGVVKEEKRFDSDLKEEHIVHVNDGRDYDDKPHPKDVEHIKTGLKKHGGELDTHSDKGVYYKFKSRSDAKNFVDHVKNSPHRSVFADLEEESILSQEEIERLDEISKATLSSYVKKVASTPAGEVKKSREKGIETASKKLHEEEVEQLDEGVKTGNEFRGYHGAAFEHHSSTTPRPKRYIVQHRIDLLKIKADRDYSSAHRKVKKHAGEAGLLMDVSKPNVMIKHYLDSVHGRHIHGAIDDHKAVTRDFAKFKKKYNPEHFKEDFTFSQEEIERLDEIAVALEEAKKAKSNTTTVTSAPLRGQNQDQSGFRSKGCAADYTISDETQQVSEVSKKTLASYITKASQDVRKRAENEGQVINGKKSDVLLSKKFSEYASKTRKRTDNIAKAAHKLAKEEVDLTEESPYDSAYKEAKMHVKSIYHKTLRHALDKMKAGHDEADTFSKIHLGSGHEAAKKVLNKHKIQTESLDLEEGRGRPRKNPLPDGKETEGDDTHKHPMQQLEKISMAMQGNEPHFEHKDGSKTKISKQLARHIVSAHNSLRTSQEKDEFAKKLHANKDSMRAAMEKHF